MAAQILPLEPALLERTQRTRSSKTRVLELLRENGWNATSFQVLEDGFEYWFDTIERACVAYVDTGGAWVAAGAPIGPENALHACATRFVDAAARAGRRACFFAAEDRFLSCTEARFASMPIGTQPIWDPALWPEKLKRSRSLKEQLRRARAKGLTLRVLAEQEVADPQAKTRVAIESLIARWLASRKMAPMGFLVDVQPFAFPNERRYVIAERAGKLVGVLVAVPIFGRRGWLFEDVLRSDDAPNGTTESMFDAAMRLVAAQGSEVVTLGLAPLAGDVSQGLRLARACSKALYDFDGLRRFKARLSPDRWDPIHLAWPQGKSGTLALVDSLAAFTMRSADGTIGRASFARFGLNTLVGGPALVIRLLAMLLIPWTTLLAASDSSTWFPHAGVKWAWVGFDVVLTISLFALARSWRGWLAHALAGAITADAVLTTLQVLLFNLRHQSGFVPVVISTIACLGPTTAALFLWTALWRARRRLKVVGPRR